MIGAIPGCGSFITIYSTLTSSSCKSCACRLSAEGYLLGKQCPPTGGHVGGPGCWILNGLRPLSVPHKSWVHASDIGLSELNMTHYIANNDVFMSAPPYTTVVF